MKSGIYNVRFTSSQNASGEGLAVFKDGTINGGDPGYLYLGSFQQEGSAVNAKLKIVQWNKSYQSVFGNVPQFELSLSGTIATDDLQFSVEGVVPQQPGLKIKIIGRRLADAI